MDIEYCPCCPKHCPLTAPHCSRGMSAAEASAKETTETKEIRCPGCKRHCRLTAPLCDRGAEALRMILNGEWKL